VAQLIARRDFGALTALAQRAQAAIGGDVELQRLMAEAQELMEAAPYVDRFLDKARQAIATGQLDEARGHLDKARALDGAHPAIAQLAAQLSASTAAAPARAAAAPAPPRPAPPPPLDEPLYSEPVAATPESGAGTADDAEATYQLPADELSFAGMPSDDDGSMDLPALELQEDSLAPPELSLEGLEAEGPLDTGEFPVGAEAGGPSDPDPRIAELLDEGQAQFSRGDLQGAIDAWSRIFLIDIDHAEAARRIDQARNAKAEHERQIEEAYQDALAQVQAKDFEAAKETLRGVLALQPNHAAAREALGKLERGELADLPKAPTASGETALLDELAAAGADELKEEILVPPEPGEGPARPAPGALKQPASRRTMLIAAAALVLLAAGGWFLKSRWTSLFPNTGAQAAVAKPAVEQTPITRANDLYRQGKRAIAIAQLKRVPPASPYYEEAQALIGQWQQEEAGTQAPTGPSPEQLAQREALLEQARQAEAERHFLAIEPLLQQAAAIAPLADEEKALSARARTALEPLKALLSLVRNEEYDRSLRDLWVILEKDSGNTDARLMLTTAYYNKGVLSLQQGKPDEAEVNLEEAAGLMPGDGDVERLLHFARTYQERNPDLLFRIYTKYLTPRPL
jgi:tetratricopeptide (TPR) repeat protein